MAAALPMPTPPLSALPALPSTHLRHLLSCCGHLVGQPARLPFLLGDPMSPLRVEMAPGSVQVLGARAGPAGEVRGLPGWWEKHGGVCRAPAARLVEWHYPPMGQAGGRWGLGME